MPKDRERSINPAAAQRKAEKQKALKKGKAAVAAQRTERLAHRNPDRLQRQIDDLKTLQESTGGKLSTQDRKLLEDLERDVQRVRKAKEAVGDKKGGNVLPVRRGDERASSIRGGGERGGRGGNTGILGKRRREGDNDVDTNENDSDGSTSTTASVRAIPMPRDTPPPLPNPRRSSHNHNNQPHTSTSNPNFQPLGHDRHLHPHPLPPKPQSNAPVVAPAQTTYTAAPLVRDLRKEATSRFVPNAVKRKLEASKGGKMPGGRFLEEEEVEALEREGYGGGRKEKMDVDIDLGVGGPRKKVGEREGNGQEEGKGKEEDRVLEEEEERWRAEMRYVQMQEVDDEDA
ncbi:hypothetical protein MMC14_008065 [Varicellaria rhodocarpa]|nr:hypothetical protein [Varicellaria rhodocarpa]